MENILWTFSCTNLLATVRNRLLDKMYFSCDSKQSLIFSAKTPQKPVYFCLVGWKNKILENTNKTVKTLIYFLEINTFYALPPFLLKNTLISCKLRNLNYVQWQFPECSIYFELVLNTSKIPLSLKLKNSVGLQE